MGVRSMLDRAVKATGTILMVCLGVRIAAWLITPAVIMTCALLFVLTVLVWRGLGPRAGP